MSKQEIEHNKPCSLKDEQRKKKQREREREAVCISENEKMF
jgi:hypothetical protein